MLYVNPVLAIHITSAGLYVDKKFPIISYAPFSFLMKKPHTHIYALFSYLEVLYKTLKKFLCVYYDVHIVVHIYILLHSGTQSFFKVYLFYFRRQFLFP